MDVRCGTGTVRDSASRLCVNPTTFAATTCIGKCGPDGGTLNSNFGTCDCKKYVTFEEQCNATCQNALLSSQISRHTDGTLQLTFAHAATGRIVKENIYSELGLPDYDRTTHKCQIVDMMSNGMLGLMLTDVSQVGRIVQTSSRRRRRAVTADPVEIRSPLICISIGEAVVFNLNLNTANRSLSNYPQYNKNHLFNTNPNFDYGNFRQLHTLMQTTNQSIKTFVQRFTEPGVHVFYDNANAARETIVVVPKAGSACPDNIGMEAPLVTKLTLNNVNKGQVRALRYSFISFFFSYSC